MKFLDLGPIDRVAGTVKLPGSKSITNRVLLLSALSQGNVVVRDPLEADDTTVMLEALACLGVRWRREGTGTLRVSGAGGPFPVKTAKLQLGNAGTAFRPLAAVLALCGGEYRMSGAARMHERPIGDLVDALRQLGASIEYLENDGYPPLAIHPSTIRGGGSVRVRGDVSSQFLTGLLIALPLTGSDTQVKVDGELTSRPYVEMTINLMRRFGIAVASDGGSGFVVPGGRYVGPGDIYVEGDASSASYFLAAGAISGLRGGGPVRVQGVGRSSIQGDTRFVEILGSMGARVDVGDNWIEVGAGPDAVSSGRLRAIDADLNHIPDAAMTAAVLALYADAPSILRNIASWRVKETDRIAAMATELRKLGAAVQEGPDFLRISPPPESRFTPGAVIETYDDHRIAMCFSLAALGGVRVRINNPGCVAKTFPEYFDVLGSISFP